MTTEILSDDILFEQIKTMGVITLNRPRALNALTPAICKAVRAQLARWGRDGAISHIVMKGAGEKAFCAGGDVVQVSRSYQSGGLDWQDFFREEYLMNKAIAAFEKPYISLVDGIVMGGGVGISLPGDYWVASEKTLFAMPETGLGLFPDVGGGWFLPRLEGAYGMYLALTGARLKAYDLYDIGLASHVVPTAAMPDLLAALAGATGRAQIEQILANHHKNPEKPEAGSLADSQDLIAHFYGRDSFGAVMASLEEGAQLKQAFGARGQAFASQQIALLQAKSPSSLLLTVAQLQAGAQMPDFAANMAMEYRLVNRMIAAPDFHEGVRALLIDKDQKPRWQPAHWRDVSQDWIKACFAPLLEGELGDA